MTTRLHSPVLHCHWSTDGTHTIVGPNNHIASIWFKKVGLSVSGTVVTNVLLIILKHLCPSLLRLSPLKRAVFLLAVKSHVTLGMTSCNINIDFRGCDSRCHTTSRDFLMAQHRSMLKIIPNTWKRKHDEQHLFVVALAFKAAGSRIWRVEFKTATLTYHNDTDGYAHSSYDVELGVKHLLNGIRTALQHTSMFHLSLPVFSMTCVMAHVAASQWACRLQ